MYVPTGQDEQVKDYIRMRDDHRLALKKMKQEINAFCLRHNLRYGGRSTWTAAHTKWLRGLEPEGLYREIQKQQKASGRDPGPFQIRAIYG